MNTTLLKKNLAFEKNQKIGIENFPASYKKTKKIKFGYGGCSQCSCPGFVGGSSTCSRSGCNHHYDEHW